MQRSIESVAVLGIGTVGELVVDMLTESGFDVVAYDAAPPPGGAVHPLDVTDAGALADALGGVDALVSCLPYALNVAVAEAAAKAGTHYFDLTEDVPTTNRVMELSREHPGTVFAPQCGLAPGLIGIVGSSLAASFDEIRSVELRVGALPRHPAGLLGYAFNWSPEGVVNEYLNDCEVLRGGERTWLPAMSEPERIVLGGVEFEAALTSGGLGTMCQTLEGRAQRLDYKSLRYPGHFQQMRFLFDELGLRSEFDLACRLLTRAKPPVTHDIVFFYAAVDGVRDGVPHREDFVRGYLPIDIGGRTWRAISWTTACSVTGVVEMVANGVLPASGFIRQEDISFDDLVTTRAGKRFAVEGRI